MTSKATPKDPAKVDRIMRAARHIFAAEGYRDAKTETIAVAAKVSKGLLFHYYGSKQALYLATVEAVTKTIMEEIDPRAYDVPNDLVTMVVQSTTYKTEFGRSHPDEMSLMIKAYGEMDQLPAKLQTQLRALYEQTMTVSRRLFGKILDQMTLRPDLDREIVIDLIMGVYNQIFTEFQVHMQQKHDIKSMADTQWIVDRAKAYMQVLELGFVQPSE